MIGARRPSRRRGRGAARPLAPFDVGLQHERTSLAWERTAISLMVAATLLARYGAEDGNWTVASAAFVLATFGGGLLLWSGIRYDDLHGPLRAGTPIEHHGIVRLTAAATVTVSAIALLLTCWLALRG